MNKRMLIDTTHAEETRVVVLDGNRLEDYDVETAAKKQLKGNIYLAKVIRVEPSLQAAFVEYGGNRHGFLAFGEIHPDYYQIPVADRERLIALQEEEARNEEAQEDARDEADETDEDAEASRRSPAETESLDADNTVSGELFPDEASPDASPGVFNEALNEAAAGEPNGAPAAAALRAASADERSAIDNGEPAEDHPEQLDGAVPETVGGESDAAEDRRPSPQSARFLRQYKIQEVIRRRQILLIQVVKEERGNKGAALTTYISLAGRFCVLMPNSPRGGGVSRKITSAADRRRLKEITAELEIPRGMAMIIRTAGAQRPRPEIRRDCEYLLRLWDDIRDQTMRAMAPALIYEEANLIKRAIRDVYTREVEEILVDGEPGWKAAREFMRNLMPANAQKVQLWRERAEPLFSYYQVEHHLDAMLQPTVQLRSGGYLVINQTEALVAIDVNSGRSTRERGIEETALRTNLEAADEVARQLRLRDLAGLIVIDFIDMEARKHNALVERRLKDALRNDRARIQLGSISHFGLMEMSRQRLRPSIAESSFVACPHCAGTGFVRGTDSAALHVLRAIEEEGAKQRAAEIVVHVASVVALYVLNHKRVWLSEIEQRHRMTVNFAVDDSLVPPQLRIEKMRSQVALSAPMPVADVASTRQLPANGVISHSSDEPFEPELPDELDEIGPVSAGTPTPVTAQSSSSVQDGAESNEEERRRKRRRRRRRGRREDGVLPNGGTPEAPISSEFGDNETATAFPIEAGHTEAGPIEAGLQPEGRNDGQPHASLEAEAPTSEDRGAARRRGRRDGGRGRNPRQQAGEPAIQSQPLPQASGFEGYQGPTPADPFGGGYDIFDMIEQDSPQLSPEPEPAQHLEPQTPPPGPAAEAVAPTAAIQPAPASSDLPLAEPGVAEPAPAEAEAVADQAAKPKRKRAAPKAKTPPALEAEAEPAVKPPPPRRSRARKATAAPALEAEAAAGLDAAPAEPSAEPVEPLAEAAGGSPLEPGPDAEAEAEDRPRTGVQPILIDTLAEPPTRRTGWWKR